MRERFVPDAYHPVSHKGHPISHKNHIGQKQVKHRIHSSSRRSFLDILMGLKKVKVELRKRKLKEEEFTVAAEASQAALILTYSGLTVV